MCIICGEIYSVLKIKIVEANKINCPLAHKPYMLFQWWIYWLVSYSLLPPSRTLQHSLFFYSLKFVVHRVKNGVCLKSYYILERFILLIVLAYTDDHLESYAQ